jgi:serine protease AprX
MRRTLGIVLVAVLCGAYFSVGPARTDSDLARLEPRVAQAARLAGTTGSLDLVLALDRPADARLTDALGRLTGWAWPFERLPAAGVRLPVALLDDLRRVDGVKGVYLNRTLDYHLADSAKLMNTERAWNDLGITGEGVTVAILDSGVDGTHPDLAPAMKQNVKLLELGSPTPVIPLEDVPNSDTSSGHGTHVAGDVASRGTQSGGRYKGMGPGASIVGLGSGEGLSIFTVLEGFDYILEHRDEYDIRVVNNSWGTEFEPFDPDNPVNVATKMVADAGVVVLFSMGNSYDEMTMGPYAAAPWVIPVAAGSKSGSVTDFTSGGIEADVVGTAFNGSDVSGDPRQANSLGLYHPSVTSTGDAVVSTRANNTVLPLLGIPDDLALGPDALWYTTMSGTSMASPETAGVVAMILQANPALTPPQVRSVLEITARPILGVPFHKQGYGYTDATGAVELALSLAGTSPAEADITLAARHAERDRALLDRELAHPKRTWAYEDVIGPGLVSLPHEIDVPAGTLRLKAVTNGPTTIEANVVEWDITVTDADGKTVAATENFPIAHLESGTAVLDIDLTDAAQLATPPDQLTFGSWTVTVDSINSPAPPPLPDTPLLDDLPKTSVQSIVSIFDAPPASCAPVPVFEAAGRQALRLQDDDPSGIPFPSDPDYTYIGPVRNGSLGTRAPNYVAADFDVITTGIPGPAPLFTTEPLAAPLTIGGAQTAEIWVQRAPQVASGIFEAALLDVAPDGTTTSIGETDGTVGVNEDVTPVQTAQDILVAKGYTIPAGHRLGLTVGVTFIGTVGDTLLYDSDEFPSGVTLTTGSIVEKVLCNVATQVQGQVTTPAAPAPAPAGPRGAALPATGPAGDEAGPALALLVTALAVAVLRRRVAG